MRISIRNYVRINNIKTDIQNITLNKKETFRTIMLLSIFCLSFHD